MRRFYRATLVLVQEIIANVEHLHAAVEAGLHSKGGDAWFACLALYQRLFSGRALVKRHATHRRHAIHLGGVALTLFLLVGNKNRAKLFEACKLVCTHLLMLTSF